MTTIAFSRFRLQIVLSGAAIAIAVAGASVPGVGIAAAARADEPIREVRDIFPLDDTFHNHASCLVQAPNGDFLVAWYRGSGERDADDVEILGARLRAGADRWSEAFPMADTPGYPDCNPALFVGDDQSLWMFWPTILDHNWESALLKFARSEDYQNDPGPPRWSKEGVLHVTPPKFTEDMRAALDKAKLLKLIPVAERYFRLVEERHAQEIYQRLGWMPRVRPVILPSGRWLLPLYTDTFSVSIVAITDDRGKTWRFSRPLIGWGNIQPAIVPRSDGSLIAYMRENGVTKRIRVATSNDEGETWSEVTSSDLPNPGAGVDAIRLADGRVLLVYNDTIAGRHSLAVSLSDDDGRTWKWTRHLELEPVGGGAFHYPSVLQAADGSIHFTYTAGKRHRGETIRHVRVNAAWIERGDSEAEAEAK